ncbi:MAG: GTP cyclohydrolase II [Rhodobacteraceae bacterium]|nr:GTP cyclohydrolase II [Paracoccaceae bacterium]
MILGPGIAELLNRARADLRSGVPVLLVDGRSTALVAAAETVSPARLEAMRNLGPVALAVTARRAGTLRARAYDGDLARIVLPPEAGAEWIARLADPAGDLDAPLRGPFATRRDGEAGLARLAIQLCKTARLLPAAVVADVASGARLAAREGIITIDSAEAAKALVRPTLFDPVISARVPMEAAEAGRLHVFRPQDGGEEHYAIEIGQPPRDRPVLARLHSACFTGDLLGSLKCDCGPQLRSALAQMGKAGQGILLYLNQEGRGIGLANKMRAYSLQDQGFDTVEANHRLGFEDDERDFRIGAAILGRMGFSEVRLMTNNPAKVAMLEHCGLRVTERVPLRVGRTHFNSGYLDTKAAKSGHIL